MTDDPHPDLAGLVAAPLEPHERMVAAAARVKAVATLPVQLPMPLRSALAHFAASLAYVGEQHRDACLCNRDSADGPCDSERIADALLGNEVAR